MSNGVEAYVCVPGGASLCEADEVMFWRGGDVGVVEAGGEGRGGGGGRARIDLKYESAWRGSEGRGVSD